MTLPGGPPARIVDAWLEERFELVTGAAQLEELVRVTRYPKIRVRIERSDAGRLLDKLRSLSVQVRPHRVFASSDPDDNLLLGLGAAARADYLVTGDKAGLLALRRFRRVRIVSAREFCRDLSLLGRRRSRTS